MSGIVASAFSSRRAGYDTFQHRYRRKEMEVEYLKKEVMMTI
jgi:hypothetical protein